MSTARLRRWLRALSLTALVAAAGSAAAQSSPDLDAARRLVHEAETRCVEVFDRCARATVCIFADPAKGGGGSGVIFRPDGYGLTNYHVVQEFVESRRGLGGLSDGQLYPLELLGIDPGGDIALFRLSGKERFDYAPLGDSDTLKVGEYVSAMGNPFLVAEDLRPTITSGIISGLHRYQEGQGNLLEYADCIQVSTSINPGNSGGPLFNARGEIIGINGRASFEERGRVNVGLGYAVTINQVRRFIPGLRAGRFMEHGTLGATVQPIGDDLVISAMQDFSPAEKAGLRLGDKLLAVDGRPMRTANDFNNAIAILPSGWLTALRFEQAGRIVEAQARLERVPLTGNVRYAFDFDRNQVEVQAILGNARRACPADVPVDTQAAVWRLSVTREDAPVEIHGEQARASPALRMASSQPNNSEDTRAASEFAAIVWPAWARPALDEAWELAGADEIDGRVVAVVERRGEEKRATRWFFDPVSDQIVGAAFVDGETVLSRWQPDAPGCWMGSWTRVLPPDEPARVKLERVEFRAREAASEPSSQPVTQPSSEPASQPESSPAPALDLQPSGAAGRPSIALRARGDRERAVQGLKSLATFVRPPGEDTQTAIPATAIAAPDDVGGFDAAIAAAQAGVVKIYAAGIGTVKSYASGVIVAADGRIVTVSSAILEDPSLRVVLADGRRYPATVVRRDETRRLAELKIEAEGLPALEPADTSRLAPGDWLISASNTFKVAEGPEAVSVSLGVFSARGELAARRRAQDFPYEGEVIYTDMIVATPGSAGGALVDATGRLVGVIGPLVKSTRTNTFANYALPAEEIAAFLAGRSHDGEAASAAAGVDLLALGVRLLDLGGRERPAYVERVRPGSPAYLAGVMPDDLIMSIAGQSVATCDDVAAALRKLKRTPKLEVVLKRGEELKTVEIPVEAAP
ncbi:MAG: trypsin-like peptidase domain-containing protein [Phycisphaerales bacterium]|nr:trypsin-like peptidase domain-containing protein [Phycisphaerales bacterium]